MRSVHQDAERLDNMCPLRSFRPGLILKDLESIAEAVLALGNVIPADGLRSRAFLVRQVSKKKK